MEPTIGIEKHEKDINDGKKAGLIGALKIGRALKAINEGNLWLPFAPTFESYCSQAHGFQKSSAYNLMALWSTWGDYLVSHPELQVLEPTRLVKLLPHATEENKEELLHMAAEIPDYKGFENNLRNLQGKTGTDDPHEHDWVSIQMERCEICGLRRKVEHA